MTQDWYRRTSGQWIPVLGVAPEPPAPEPPPPGEITHGTQLTVDMVGLPAGWSGTNSGAIVSTHDGQTIENRNVDVSSGPAIEIRHNNVTVQYCRVSHRSGANGVVIVSGVTGATVQFNHFNGHYRTSEGNFGSIGVLSYGAAYTYRNFFQGGRDGTHPYGRYNQFVENWVDDLHKNPGAHNDAVHMGGRQGRSDVVIARNRVVAGSPGGIDLYPRHGPLQGVDIFDNYVVGKGVGFGIRGGRTPFHDHSNNTDIRIEGNRFSGTFGYPDALGEGTNAGVDTSKPGHTWVNNRWVDGSSDLPARCGVTSNACD